MRSLSTAPRPHCPDEQANGEADQSRDVVALLDCLLNALDDAWPAASSLISRARSLRQRLVDERFQLAVLGQFKRGKSTFLNALLGAPILPTGVIPLTAVPTFISWSPTPLVRVTYRTDRSPERFCDSAPDDIRSRLFGYVAEEANPKNRLNVARVDLSYPAAILKNGVVLIDTPGIGSTHRHNTDAALEVLSECDAALFVVSADPPITEAELAYLDLVRSKVARLFLILNKADYLAPHELQVATSFLRRTLQGPPLSIPDARVFCISALQGLKAKASGGGKALQESGLTQIEDHLLRYLANEKAASLRAGVIQKAGALLSESDADLSLHIRTLEMPVEDLAKRTATLETALRRIADEERVVLDLVAGDRRRAVGQLEDHAECLREAGRQYLAGVIDRALSAAEPGSMEEAAQQAVASAIPRFFEQRLGDTSDGVQQTVDDILHTHERRADDLINLVRRTAADIFDVPYAPSAGSERFALRHQPYWVTEKWTDRLVPIPTGLVDRVLAPDVRRKRLRARLKEQAGELVLRNVENLRWSTLQSLDDTFRRFAAMLQDRLAAAIDSTKSAIDAAASKRRAASIQVDAELASMRATSAALANLRAELQQIASTGEATHSPARPTGDGATPVSV